MARPEKQGIDYFPLDVNCDDKFELIEAKHGIVGFGVLIKLLQRIYKNGYYIELTEELLLIFSKSINVDINKINDIIKDAVKYGIFEEKLYKKNILTSNGIQKRYIGACMRRNNVTLDKNIFFADINGINVNINWINTDIGTQRKLKEIKLNEIKVNDSSVQQNDDDKIHFGEGVFCDEKSYVKLYYKYGYKLVDQTILALVDFWYHNPKKKKDKPELSIQNWLTRDINAGKYTAKPEPKNSVILPERFVDYFNQRYEEHGYTTTLENVLEVMQQFDDIRKYIVLSRDEERLNAELLKKARAKV